MSASFVRNVQTLGLHRLPMFSEAFRHSAGPPLALACSLILLLVLSAPPPAASWKDVLVQAETAVRAGNRLAAAGLYSRAARVAASRQDWTGALAAACGMKRLESARADYAVTRRMLIRTMILAEKQQSASGLNAVADAFAAIGEPAAASLSRARIAPGAGSEFAPTGYARTCF